MTKELLLKELIKYRIKEFIYLLLAITIFIMCLINYINKCDTGYIWIMLVDIVVTFLVTIFTE